jgi:hypothetical protein
LTVSPIQSGGPPSSLAEFCLEVSRGSLVCRGNDRFELNIPLSFSVEINNE